jgi:hypothetical protein
LDSPADLRLPLDLMLLRRRLLLGHGRGNLGQPRQRLAEGEPVIKYKSPLNVLKDTYDHSCY